MSAARSRSCWCFPTAGGFRCETMTIGRGEDATLKLDDRTVSRLARADRGRPAGPMIEDAGSRFGVTVSGQPLSAPCLLPAGQEIQLGNVVLRVESAVRASRRAGEVGWAIAGAANPNATIVVPSARRRWGCARRRAWPATARSGRGCGPDGRSSGSTATPTTSATCCATCRGAVHANGRAGRAAARAARRPATGRRAAGRGERRRPGPRARGASRG